MRKIYIYPKFSKYEFFGFRIGGNGLGNLLFIFARAVIYAKKYQVELINPTWRSIKLGTILRGERDARTYSDLFDKPIGISGIKKFFLLFFAKKYPENKVYPIFLAMTYYNLAEYSQAMELLLRTISEIETDIEIKTYQKAIAFYADKLDRVW